MPIDRSKFNHVCRQCRGSMSGRSCANAVYCFVCSAQRQKESRRRAITPLQTLAHAYVHSAIRLGILAPLSGLRCSDCAKPATQYDHRDYAKPLEVDPVCGSCNMRRGPGLNSGKVKKADARFDKQKPLLIPRSRRIAVKVAA
jgi:hypothetical protein